MKMMFLLVPAVALLVGPAVAKPAVTRPAHHKPDHNLNRIIDLAQKYNNSLVKEFWLEDVSHLAEGSGKCEDKFFCKVYELLHKRQDRVAAVEEIVRNLNMYNNRYFNCKEVLKELKPTGVTIRISKLLDNLTKCSRHRNFTGANTSSL